jgi:diguanylate cyclase (GGDEF)-like protein
MSALPNLYMSPAREVEELLQRAKAEKDNSYLEQAKQIANTQENQETVTRCHFLIACYYLDNTQEIEMAKTILLTIPTQLENALEAERLQLLARSYLQLEDYQNAVNHALEALPRCRELENLYLQFSCFNTLCHCYGELGLLDESVTYGIEGVEKITKHGLTQMPVYRKILNNLAVTLSYLGEHQRSLHYYHLCLEHARETKSLAGEGNALNNIGTVYHDLSDHPKSLEYFKQALKISGPINDSDTVVWALNNCGTAYRHMKQLNKANHAYFRALKELEKVLNPAKESLVKSNIGKVYELQKKFVLSERYQLFALGLAEKLQASQRIMGAHQALFELYEAWGNYPKAFFHHKAYHELKVKELEQAASSKTKGMMVKFEVEKLKQEQEIYRLKNVELAAAMTKLEELSNQDSLTGLYNRRFFDKQLRETFSQAKNQQLPLTVMIADIDNFKLINDTFSHAVGDDVLRIIASLFTNTLRGSDVVVRYGGEEIVALFPETTLENAKLVCEKICQKIEHYPWHKLHPALKVTMSMGLADDLALANPEKLLSVADAVLYRVKHSGKNRVEG